jgi:hypothetical protein
LIRVAHAPAEAALIRAQPAGHPEETAWALDEKGKLKTLAAPAAVPGYFAGVFKISIEGIASMKKVLGEPKWWTRPLGDAVAFWGRHRAIKAIQ